MKAKKLFLVFLFLFVLVSSFSSCAGGEELARVEGAEYTFRLFGGANGISRVDIYSGGDKQGSVKPDYRVNEPWLGEDKQDYGFRAFDIDGDGEVKAKDLSLLQKLIVGSYTVKQLAEGR